MMAFKSFRMLMLSLLLILSGCAHHQKILSEKTMTVYRSQGTKDALILRHAPLFRVYKYSAADNRIGRPTARYDDRGSEQIYVDTDNPVIYYLKRNFATKNHLYTNLIYRVHFPKVPFSLIPFHFTAGKNVGLMIVITLDSEQKPVLVTAVHTCGCYLAIVPTSFLPDDVLPLKWRDTPISVYGERLPPRLNVSKMENPQFLVHLRPGVHRVMDIEVINQQELMESQIVTVIPARLKPVRELERIPLNGGTTSLYYDKGVLRGHVKGSVKPWESIFLGLLSLDFFVGTDKAYADRNDTGNPFYTSLKPWNRNESDMWNFARFLEFWGWRL
jgi:hypothetical protein